MTTGNITNNQLQTTALRALATNSNGYVAPATTTAAELDYVSGVTSNIQTQLNTKITASSADVLTNKSIDADTNTLTNIANASIKAAAAIAVNKLAALTASRATVTDGSGFIAAATTTATEIGYVNGVTSGIQTQLNAKGVGSVTSVAFTDGLNTVGGAAITTTGTARLNLAIVNGFRLSLNVNLPVPTTDISGASTIYLLPYTSDEMSLYIDTTQQWVLHRDTGTGLAIPSTTNTGYDVFAYSNVGVITLEFLAWTNLTTRATNLTYKNGVLVKQTDFTRRYLGSLRTIGSSGQTDDSSQNRYVWNYYNRVARPLLRVDSTATWNYTSTTIRQANASTANQLNFFVGAVLDSVNVQINAFMRNASGAFVAVYVGLNSTTTPAAASISPLGTGTAPAVTAVFNGYLAAPGAQALMWLEASQVSGTTGWFGYGAGPGGGMTVYTGMSGICYT